MPPWACPPHRVVGQRRLVGQVRRRRTAWHWAALDPGVRLLRHGGIEDFPLNLRDLPHREPAAQQVTAALEVLRGRLGPGADARLGGGEVDPVHERPEPVVGAAGQDLALQVDQRHAPLLRQGTQGVVELAGAFQLRLERRDGVRNRDRAACEDQVQRLAHVLAVVLQRHAVLHVVDPALDRHHPRPVLVEHLLQGRQAALAAGKQHRRLQPALGGVSTVRLDLGAAQPPAVGLVLLFGVHPREDRAVFRCLALAGARPGPVWVGDGHRPADVDHHALLAAEPRRHLLHRGATGATASNSSANNLGICLSSQDRLGRFY
jgi:hypothetical protein